MGDREHEDADKEGAQLQDAARAEYDDATRRPRQSVLTFRVGAPKDMYAHGKLSSKNQLTLPAGMLRVMGWQAGDELEMMVWQDEIILTKAIPADEMADALYGSMAHVPEWQTKEQIDAWVRRERDSWDREWDEEG